MASSKTDAQTVSLALSVMPEDFAELLFGACAEEDLARYPEALLKTLAQEAYAHLAAPRPANRESIRLTEHAYEQGGRMREFTVLEIVNDNMPFLLDSTLAELVEQGYDVHLVAHPVLAVARDQAGGLQRFVGLAKAAVPTGTHKESLIHIHLDRIDNESARARLVEALARVYADVRSAVQDWPAMRARLAMAVEEYKLNPPPLSSDEVAEAVQFLEWLADDNFLFLGIREYRFAQRDAAADPVAGTGLGILRNPDLRVLLRGGQPVVITPEIRAFLSRPVALIITRADIKSRVHRRAYLSHIGVKIFADAGELSGELQIIGLFTSNAYTCSTADIPYIRKKVAYVIQRAGFDAASYSGRALAHVLETYPRDEVFQISADQLYDMALEILHLIEHPRLRALPRMDEFGRYVSVIVFIPKDRYDTQVRIKVGDFLAKAYGGQVLASDPYYPEGPLARTHYIIGGHEKPPVHIPRQTLEAGIAGIVRTWSDTLRLTLEEKIGGASARVLAMRYADAFSAAYREAFSAEEALQDITTIETLSESQRQAVILFEKQRDGTNFPAVKIFSRGSALPLSILVPRLERLRFRVLDERTYRIVPADNAHGVPVWLYEMVLENLAPSVPAIDHIAADVTAALVAQFQDIAESDAFDGLITAAGMNWREVALFRAIGYYLRQLRIRFALDYLAEALIRQGEIAQTLMALFRAKFDPALDSAQRQSQMQELRQRIEKQLQSVLSLDDDRILRRFWNIIEAAIRTNFFQTREHGKVKAPQEVIAFKLDCARVDGMPKPRPRYEIFVHGPRVEGTHVRFGKVARGGIRWSDRPQDFRSEILALAKAQQVKNAVIVPLGAKGGFIAKRLPPKPGSAEWFEEGKAAYRIFIRTLLDLTDNLVGQQVVPPKDVVRYDDDDPYFVVAADKGTATFSDIANAIALEKGFWLGDAFASGGSHGYDHKKLGITARGAWEAVKRHFREMDIDINERPITVVGVGDMSGDVFGNGMLLSKKLCLVAAFDYRDIFLDPNPDPEVAFEERKRLFEKPNPSWQDYNRALISKGGGVFSRSLKTIPLSKEVQAALAIDQAEATPEEVIRAILAAPVDLLWFGGIGTYVRASGETDDEVGDRANDALRISARELRCKVIGEGANLGCTQRGRIEAAQRGIRLNTDAIDNSAGVNTSDLEVNIKIALNIPMQEGKLTLSERNDMLAGMADDVVWLVLANNYRQTLTISLSEREGAASNGAAARLMQMLESNAELDRAVEYLPDEKELAARSLRREGLTRPEWAALLAYAKLDTYNALLHSKLPDDPYLEKELIAALPQAISKKFPQAIRQHPLRREIIATHLANAMINHAGPTILPRIADEAGGDAVLAAAAFVAAWNLFDIGDLVQEIDALDGRIRGASQLRLYADLQNALREQMVWLVQNGNLHKQDLSAVLRHFREGIDAAAPVFLEIVPDPYRAEMAAREERYRAEGVPAELAQRLLRIALLRRAPDIVAIAEATGRKIADVAATYFALEDWFGINAALAAGAELTTVDYVERLALDRTMIGILAALRRATANALLRAGTGEAAAKAWLEAAGVQAMRAKAALAEFAHSGLALPKLVVAAGYLSDLSFG